MIGMGCWLLGNEIGNMEIRHWTRRNGHGTMDTRHEARGMRQ